MAEDNEILAEVRQVLSGRAGAQKERAAARAKRGRLGSIGVGVGLGAAALAAAVMFANRDPKG